MSTGKLLETGAADENERLVKCMERHLTTESRISDTNSAFHSNECLDREQSVVVESVCITSIK